MSSGMLRSGGTCFAIARRDSLISKEHGYTSTYALFRGVRVRCSTAVKHATRLDKRYTIQYVEESVQCDERRTEMRRLKTSNDIIYHIPIHEDKPTGNTDATRCLLSSLPCSWSYTLAAT